MRREKAIETMDDKALKGNDITKFWEEVLREIDTAPVAINELVFSIEIAKNTLKQINEQKAEIERLRHAVREARCRPMHKLYNADFVKYKKLLFDAHRQQAIKEFAEKYKAYIKSFTGMFTDEIGFAVSLEAVLHSVDFILENAVTDLDSYCPSGKRRDT